MIAINRTGYQRQGDRLNNLHNEVKYEITSKHREYQLLTPVPIDINYEVSVIAKYQADIDKIASNFMVFFNNDIYVSQEHPKWEGIKLNNQIIMSDNVNEEHPDQIDATQDDLIISTFNFTFKTYLFGGTKKNQIVKNQEVSSWLSTVTVDQIVVIQPDDIDDFQKKYPTKEVSSTIEQTVVSTLTSLIDLSDDIYDDGIPKIKTLDFGFYAIPTKEDIIAYMLSVDNEMIVKHEHFKPPAYISSESYGYQTKQISDDEGNVFETSARISSDGDFYEPVDEYCSLAPYVDRIKWAIDTSSQNPFPYNIKAYGDFEDLSDGS